MEPLNKKWRIMGLTLGVVGLGALAFVVLQSALRGWRELHPPRVAIEGLKAKNELTGLIDVSLRTEDGLKLAGWYVPSRNRAAVLLVHGFGSNREQLIPHARVLAAEGYGVLMLDLRAHGESEGTRCSWGDAERRDVKAALDFLSARAEVDGGRIGGLGISLGAATLALAAADDQRLAALILEATVSSLEEGAYLDPPRWGWFSAAPGLAVFRAAGIDVVSVRPVDALARVAPRPFLLVYGENDLWIPREMRERMMSRGESWVAPCGHADCFELVPEVYGTRMIEFFTRSLK